MESTIARDNVKHLFLMSSFRGSGVAEVVLQRAAQDKINLPAETKIQLESHCQSLRQPPA